MTATFLDRYLPHLGQEPFQKKAWERFLQVGLPTKEQEAFRYLPLEHIYESNPSEMGWSVPKDIPSSIVALPLSAAKSTYAAYLEKRLLQWLSYEKDPFALLAAAHKSETLFLYIPPNLQIEKPLHLEASKILLHVGAGSHVKLLLKATFCDLQLEDGSHVEIERQINHLQMFRANVKQNATLKSVAFTTESHLARDDYHVRLMGENAEAKLFGLSLLQKEGGSAHTHVLMEHVAPHTRSLQTFKGVVGERCYSTFEGKIYVHQKAQKTEGYQVSLHLLLSPKAKAKAKPNLEIFADDVKASHGATIGKLDEEAYFYLLSRGMEKKRARQILIDAFCREVMHESIAC